MTKKTVRPNILLIMTDEQRFDAVGYMNKAVKTPHLDTLAEESLRFTRAYTSNPSCVPARAALFTGKFPSRCGAPTFITYLPDDEVTFMARLRDGGYSTSVVGKQHFGQTSIDRGYDYEDIIDSHFPPQEPIKGINSYIDYLCEEGVGQDDLVKRNDRFSHIWIGEQKYYIDDFVGRRGVERLKEILSENHPWFCTVSFPGPHMPYDGAGLPQEELYSLEDTDIPGSLGLSMADKPHIYEKQISLGHGNPGIPPLDNMTEEECRRVRLSYYANMTLIDEYVGQMVKVLKENSQYDNTLILFTSDHGDFMGEFGMLGKGQFLSEVLMRVPFLLKPPVSGFAGRNESSLISTVDVAATCLEAAGLPVPQDMQSRSLLPCTYFPVDLDNRDTVYFEAQHLRGIRDKKYKFVLYKDRDYGELYDLNKDPFERENLWNHSELLPVRECLARKLIDTLISFEDKSSAEWNRGAPEV